MDADRVALTVSPTLSGLARWLWPLPVAWLTVFVVVPVVTIVARATTLDAWSLAVSDEVLRDVWWFTTWQTLASTLLTVLLGLPVAWLVARVEFPGRRALRVLVTVPFVLPTVVVGGAFLAVLPRDLHYTAIAVVLAHAYFNVAVVVRVVGARWERLDPRLAEVAATLGASPAMRLRTVVAPLLAPAVASASAVVALLCFTSYGVVRILGGPARQTVESEIYLRAVAFGDVPTALALSVVQMVALTAAMIWWVRRFREPVPISADARRRTSGRLRLAAVGIGGTAALIVAAPLVAIVVRSLSIDGRLSPSGWRAVASGDLARALGVSLAFALATAVVATILGGSIALAVAYGPRRLRVLEGMAVLPLTVSSVTIGLGILVTFDRDPFDLRASVAVVPVAHSLVAIPLVVRLVLPVVRAIPERLREVASTLGASPWTVWRTIDAPLVAGAAVGAAAISMAVSIGEFGATSILARRTTETLPVAIARLLGRPGDVLQAQGYALSTILVAFALVTMLVVDAPRSRRRRP